MLPRFAVLVSLAVTLPLVAAPARAADHVAPPAGKATDYPAVDVHAKEKVAIAADPYNTKAKASIFRVDYVKYGILPIRIIVTNDGDRPISLADARINFITAAGDRIGTTEIPDAERRINRIKRPDSGYKLPGPLPRLGSKSATKSKDIEADFHSFEYSAVVVEPHTTRAGFFFYDVSGIADPLAGAKLNLNTLRDADGKELFYFEIPFDKYLAADGASRSDSSF